MAATTQGYDWSAVAQTMLDREIKDVPYWIKQGDLRGAARILRQAAKMLDQVAASKAKHEAQS